MGSLEWFILLSGFLAGFCVKAWMRIAYDIQIIQEQRKIIRGRLEEQAFAQQPYELGPPAQMTFIIPGELLAGLAEEPKKDKGN